MSEGHTILACQTCNTVVCQEARLEPLSFENLPEPSCFMGYDNDDLLEIIGVKHWSHFWEWMRGQTLGLCQGYETVPRSELVFDTVPTKCYGNPHGLVAYPQDVITYLKGMDPLD